MGLIVKIILSYAKELVNMLIQIGTEICFH